ncbi:hypothetical protein HXX76_007911 [Chlamydomonas incerta]|uniref:10 kDa chaperonin n=1 Tax=Chlamydomonas incerta TaxID=51695 RepID=A0A835VZZ7_CHLIN|nr:hypothetical protein HXX76_007911 [Chlamydomonas incerta]|eukprot:KAG2434185.1 hypothetical protein HXX76_007911 [Chlamydomonas incerta]
MTPIHDRVLIRPIEEEQKTAGLGRVEYSVCFCFPLSRVWPTLNLYLHVIEEEQKTAGGILLPKAPPKANSDAHIGEVLAIGSEVTLSLAKGDMVVYQKYAMAEVEVKEGQIIFVAEKSIMGKLE